MKKFYWLSAISYWILAALPVFAQEAVALPNPLGTTNAAVIVGRIIGILIGFVGGIALLVFIYGGFQWLTALGNPEKIKKGRDIMLWAVLGMAIMFGSYIVARFIIVAITTGAGV